MSLYGGIKFTVVPPPTEYGSSAKPSLTKETVETIETIEDKDTSTTTATSSEKAKSAATGEWSAALKFAPRIPKVKPAAAPPRPSGFSNPPGPVGSVTSYSAAPVITAQPDIVRSAEPVIHSLPLEEEVALGPDGKPLAKAPAMILTGKKKGKGKGKRAGDVRGGDGAKKKKKKKKKNVQPLMPTFDPDEQYDPNKPNDLGEYQQYRKRVREERRAKIVEEKRRKAAGEESSEEGSSYYTDSDEAVAPRRDAPRLFAPPKMYNSPPRSTPALPPPPPTSTSGNKASAQSYPATGDDAYARRAALAQSTPPASGDDAYARRLAISQAKSDLSPPTRPLEPEIPPPPSPPHSFVPPPPPSDPAPPIPGFSARRPPPPPSQPPKFFPPPASIAAAAPGPTPGTMPFRPPPNLAPPRLTPAVPPVSDEFALVLEEKKRAAEAIAAKFKALAGTSGPSPSAPVSVPPLENETGTFAEKMMKRWGHKDGTGLGARGEGIVHALAAEHVVAPTDPSQPLSKRQIAKQRAAAANAKNKNWVQNASARGRIVNTNEDERAKEEKERVGEASRVICLVGLVGGVDEVDEDLSEEIGEECSKHGIVERVVLHMVEPPPVDPAECLRVFVVFSGMAGAWRNIKELNGRFFGGQKIRATYFDETRFDAGDRDGDIL